MITKRQIKQGDMFLRENGEVCWVKEIEPASAEDLAEAVYLMSEMSSADDVYETVFDIEKYTYITSLGYLQKSTNSKKVKEARSLLESKGHTVNYLGDGMYVINQFTSKAFYAFGASLLETAHQLQTDIEAKRKKQEEKEERRKNNVKNKGIKKSANILGESKPVKQKSKTTNRKVKKI